MSQEARSITPNISLASALSWAVYLGMSWTWCIGMFLPVLLVRQMGLAAFWVFAVPNVLGAAAMGFVLRQGVSERLMQQHRGACAAFSAVTIAFHVFFAAWMVRAVLGEWGVVIALSATGLFYIVGRSVPGGDRPMAAAVLALSVMVAVLVLQTADAIPKLTPPPASFRQLIPLAAACAFGFLLCPYLDLTFHRARQANNAAAARLAFSLGFGVFFLAMILFTLAYALMPLLHTTRIEARSGAFRLAQTYIGFHITAQSAFTVAIHLRELGALPVVTRRRSLVLLVLLAVAAAAAGVWAAPGGVVLGLDRGELAYRLFMGFYGLLFPAYVYLCMLPGSAPDRRRSLVLTAAVLAAAPFFYLGFIRGAMHWLPIGVALLLACRLLTAGGQRSGLALDAG